MATLAPPHSRPLRWGQSEIFGSILFFGLLALTARNAIDPDLWWHLRTGQWIVETGHVPHTDPFSFTRAGHAWIAHEWLSEFVFYELWKHAGPAALIVFSSLVTTAGFMLLYFRCPGQRHWAVAATVLGAFVAAPSWGTRPQMFTFTLASLLLWLLERGEDRPTLLWWIPPLFIVWLNLHGGFAVGPALLIAYALGLLSETACGTTSWREVRPILLRVFLLVLACVALIPFNPNRTRMYLYPFETLHSSGIRSLIAEWLSPNFHAGSFRPLMLLWLILLIVLAASRSRPKGRVLVPLLLTAFASLDAARHAPIFALIAIPVIAAASPMPLTLFEKPAVGSPRRSLKPIFISALLVLIAGFTLTRWITLTRLQSAREAESFPKPAVATLQSSRDPHRIFAFYDWGGYVIWKLYPDYRVFVDGRSDLYGDVLLQQSMLTVMSLRSGWRDILDRQRVDTVLVPASSALAQALLLDPGWRASYQDTKAIVLLRTRPNLEKTGITLVLWPEVQKNEKMFPRAVQICETEGSYRKSCATLVPKGCVSFLR
jgi:hypothetical protein